MSITRAEAALLCELIDAGLDPEALKAAIVRAAERGAQAEAGELSPGAVRQRRWRERLKASQSVSRDVTRDASPPQCEAGCSSSNLPEKSNPTPPPVSPPPRRDADGDLLFALEPEELPITGFAAFWSSYPNKVGKRAAEKAWATASQRASPTVILFGLEAAKRCRKWAEGIIPNPATWLNQDRWCDQPDDRARPTPMTAGMVAAASDELAFQIATGARNPDGSLRTDGNPQRDQGALLALSAPTVGRC